MSTIQFFGCVFKQPCMTVARLKAEKVGLEQKYKNTISRKSLNYTWPTLREMKNGLTVFCKKKKFGYKK